jgi:hypothetical protein
MHRLANWCFEKKFFISIKIEKEVTKEIIMRKQPDNIHGVYFVDDKNKPKRTIQARSQDWSALTDFKADSKYAQHLKEERRFQRELMERNLRYMHKKEMIRLNQSLRSFDIEKNIDHNLLRDDKYLSLCRYKPINSNIFDKQTMHRIIRCSTTDEFKIKDGLTLKMISNKCERCQLNNKRYDERMLNRIFGDFVGFSNNEEEAEVETGEKTAKIVNHTETVAFIPKIEKENIS